MNPAPPARDVVLFSTADWSEPYWTNKQHTARLLARRGFRVLYVESPGLRAPRPGSARDWSRLARRLAAGLRSLASGPRAAEPNLAVLSPLTLPGARGALSARLNAMSLGTALRRARRTGPPPIVWTYHPFMLGELNALRPSLLVYHCVDDLGAVPGIDPARFRAAEDALIDRADIVFATSPRLAERCAARNPRTHYLPNVADAGHFGAALLPGPLPADLAAIPAPRLGYHGVLSDFKIDFALLRAVAGAHPEWSFVLIGGDREGEAGAAARALAGCPNIHLLGYRPYADLPAYLRGIDVGLLPNRRNDYTSAMYPMKFHEYLAAGVPIVATPLPFAEAPNPALRVAATPTDFAAAIAAQLARGRLTPEQAARAVGDNTWERRLDRMLALAGLDPAAAPGRIEA